MARDVKSKVDVRIVLHGRPRSKKNGKEIIKVGGAPRLISSKEYLRWEAAALVEAASQYSGPKIEVPVFAIASIYQDHGQSIDTTNAIEGTWDVLQKAGVIKNDYLIEATYLQRFRDQKDPRIEVRLVDMDSFFRGRVAQLIRKGELL